MLTYGQSVTRISDATAYLYLWLRFAALSSIIPAAPRLSIYMLCVAYSWLPIASSRVMQNYIAHFIIYHSIVEYKHKYLSMELVILEDVQQMFQKKDVCFNSEVSYWFVSARSDYFLIWQ